MTDLLLARNPPDPIAVFVGSRVRAFRKSRRMSLIQLGNTIGVSYQQLQKYEYGVNRVSAPQLWRLSKALNVGIIRFFPGETREASEDRDEKAVGLAMAIGRLDPAIRSLIIALIEAIADRPDPQS